MTRTIRRFGVFMGFCQHYRRPMELLPGLDTALFPVFADYMIPQLFGSPAACLVD